MKILIYSKPDCFYCQKSKDYLNKCNRDFSIITIDPKKSSYTIERDALFYKYNQKSFPLILVNDKFIGGYTELIAQINPKISFNDTF